MWQETREREREDRLDRSYFVKMKDSTVITGTPALMDILTDAFLSEFPNFHKCIFRFIQAPPFPKKEDDNEASYVPVPDPVALYS